MRNLIFGSLALPLAIVFLGLPGPSPSSDEEAIEAAVENYFAGMMRAEPALLKVAFHEQSRLIGVGGNGKAMIIPFDDWASGWEGRPARDLSTHTNRILSIDVHGNAASVKTDLVWPNVRYIDYLSLLKVGGEWKIVNKIWAEEQP